MKPENYLPHIDGLRAAAVLAVIAYHFDESLLYGGYLGVDIFFVVSGFVITGQLSRAQKVGRAQFLFEFYLKRLRRIVPALLVCLAIVAAAFLLLTTRPSGGIFHAGAAASLGVSNNFLWLQSSDYFSVASSLNPFTHTWSLGVEEQFYLLFPGLLAILGFPARSPLSTRAVSRLLLAVTAASLAIFLTLSRWFPTASFYLLPSRAWELGAGCLAYFFFETKRTLPSYLTTLGMLAIVAGLLSPQLSPQLATITVVIGTVFVILTRHTQTTIYRVLVLRPVIWIGRLSYSLYLWHWPALVLAQYTIGDQGNARWWTAFTFMTLAIASHYAVERPLRHRKLTRSPPREMALYFLAIAGMALGLWFVAPRWKSAHNNLLASSFGIEPVKEWSVDCHGKWSIRKKQFPYQQCLIARRSVAKPLAIYLIGDSHAAHLTFMFNKTLQGTRYQLRFINDELFPFDLMGGSSSSTVLNVIADTMQPDDLVVLSFHRGRLNSKRDRHLPLGETIEPSEETELLLSGILPYWRRFQEAGVGLMVIRDTPLMGSITTSPSCKLQSQLFGTNSCRVSLSQDLHTRTRQDYFYDQLLKQFPDTCVWDPLLVLYGDNQTWDVTTPDGHYSMLDWNHLTERTSEALAAPFLPVFHQCAQRQLTP